MSDSDPAVFDNTFDCAMLQRALEQAKQARQAGEVPVGAVLVSGSGEILGQGYNCSLSAHDPTAHAEIQALRAAAHARANHRLEDCTLYVTLEPCAMCSGALLHARLARVVYAVADPKTGAAGSVLNLFAERALNHQTVCEAFAPADAAGMALRSACAAMLQDFFQQRRLEHRTRRRQAAYAGLREDALRLPDTHFAGFAALQALDRWGSFVLLRDPDEPDSLPWRMRVLDTTPQARERPAVLLLHGYASYSLLWAQWMTSLNQAGWRVLAPDLPGHGLSDKPKKMQRHRLEWYVALLQQWLQQAGFSCHAYRAAVLHDSAIGLLPELASACEAAHMPLAQAIFLQAETPAAWRQACLQRPGFDLDAHWALDPGEAATGVWSAPWPDAGHRAALQSTPWSHAANPSLLHGTIAAPATCIMHPVSIPSGGAAFRRWLQLHSDKLQTLLTQGAVQAARSHA